MIVSLDEVKDHIDVETDEDDAVLEQMTAAAQAIVESHQGITYPDTATIVEFLRGTGTSDLYLFQNPTADPTQVLERADVGDSGTAITAAQSDGWVRRGIKLVRKQCDWKLDYEYQVTYAGGYAEGDAPADVRKAVMNIVGVLYGKRGDEAFKSETIGPYSYTAATSDEAVKAILLTLPARGVFA